MIELLSLVILCCAVFSAAMFARNLRMFTPAPSVTVSSASLPAVSVLIPARNEAQGIGRTIDEVLANEGIDFEVIVLDDQSQDATAEVVAGIADRDARVRLVHGKPLPSGWCGKQYASYQLAQHAAYDELLFVDADVRLTPDALRRSVSLRQTGGADLLSGFPRQVVGTLGEAMLVPLIHIVLLTYLPFRLMRHTKMESASAGCGQFFLTDREAYQRSGGHAAIKASLHDGVTLPRAYRRANLTTDVFDAADVANCRMYRGWSQTWRGLMKNAHEGIANERLILPATFLMVVGYLAPAVLAVSEFVSPHSTWTVALAASAAAASYLPRLVTAARFDKAWLSASLFPISILLFVALQWIAFRRHLRGSQSHWRGRAYPASY